MITDAAAVAQRLRRAHFTLGVYLCQPRSDFEMNFLQICLYEVWHKANLKLGTAAAKGKPFRNAEQGAWQHFSAIYLQLETSLVNTRASQRHTILLSPLLLHLVVSNCQADGLVLSPNICHKKLCY